MIQSIMIIAFNTFRETIRNKVLYNILLFAVIIIALSISFGEWSVFARQQVMMDFGLATMSISSLMLAVFIGVGMLGRELTAKTIYLMASKPISRTSIILGKFFGLCATLYLNILIMAFLFIGVLQLVGGTFSASLWDAILLICCEMFVIVAAALFFSTFSTATLSAILTIAFYGIGHFNDMVDIGMIDSSHTFYTQLLKVIYFLLPNLEHFNLRSVIVYDLPVAHGYVLYAAIYGIIYGILLLFFSCTIFARKDM